MTLTRMSYDKESIENLQHAFHKPMSRIRANRWQKETRRPSKLGVYVWQIPAVLLTIAILLFVIGLNIWVFQAAVRELTWGDDKKV